MASSIARVLLCLLPLYAMSADAQADRSGAPSVAVWRVRGARTAREIHRKILRSRSQLAQCQTPLCGEITLDIDVLADGTTHVRRTRLSSWDEQREAGACVSAALEDIVFEAADGDTSARVVVGLDRCLPSGVPAR